MADSPRMSGVTPRSAKSASSRVRIGAPMWVAMIGSQAKSSMRTRALRASAWRAGMNTHTGAVKRGAVRTFGWSTGSGAKPTSNWRSAIQWLMYSRERTSTEKRNAGRRREKSASTAGSSPWTMCDCARIRSGAARRMRMSSAAASMSSSAAKARSVSR